MRIVGNLGKVTTLKSSQNILILDIDNIKVDFVNYRYLPLKPIKIIDGIRLLSTTDIGAMKLAAIVGRGRKRDFTDLYFLLQAYNLRQLLDFYNEKYFDGSEMMVVRSLTYFEDAENDTVPELLEIVSWETVKDTILKAVRELYQ